MSYASNSKKFIHTIPNISALDEQTTSEVFIQGVPWCVEFVKQPFEDGEWFSFYLSCNNKDESNDWSRAAFVSVKLLPFEKRVEPISCISAPYVFGHSFRGFGCAKFIKWDQLTNTRNGYVRDGLIRLEIKIEIADPNDENQSTLKFDVLDKCCERSGYASFQLTVFKIDALMAVGTSDVIMRGIHGKISVFNHDSKWLGVRLETAEVSDYTWTTIVKLISKKDFTKNIIHELEGGVDELGCMEKADFVRWDKLFDDDNGFVQDNSIQLQIKITADRPGDDIRSANKRPSTNNQNEEAKSSKLVCSICWEEIRDQQLSSLPCTHVFCTECIKSAIRSRKKCPICNAAVKLVNLRRIRLPL